LRLKQRRPAVLRIHDTSLVRSCQPRGGLLPAALAGSRRPTRRDGASTGTSGRLPAGTLDPLPDSLPADDYVRLLDIAAGLANDPHFGLHVGQCVKLGTYTVYGLILLSCRDFGQVFEQTMRYEQLAHDLGRSGIAIDDDIAHYTWHSNYGSASATWWTACSPASACSATGWPGSPCPPMSCA
jgi:hypothetical protein